MALQHRYAHRRMLVAGALLALALPAPTLATLPVRGADNADSTRGSQAGTPEAPYGPWDLGSSHGTRVLGTATGRVILQRDHSVGPDPLADLKRPEDEGGEPAAEADGAGAGDEATGVAGDWDPRLAGHRRTRFYRELRPTTGPGTITSVAGGMCDGGLGTEVAVDPATVKVDRAGRVFWVDHNSSMHFKGQPYIRTLGLDGRVRTLGTIGGPIEGRNRRDNSTASGFARITPDERGGVYYAYNAYFSIGDPDWPTDAGDDVPIATVIGRLTADGKAEFVSGTLLNETVRGSWSFEGEEQYKDGGPYAEAAYSFIAALDTDADGNLYVVDGPVAAWGQKSASGQTAGRGGTSQSEPGAHYDTAPYVVRFLNMSDKPVTFYEGTVQEVTVAPGTIDRIAGDRQNELGVPSLDESEFEDVYAKTIGLPTGIDVDRNGNIRLLHNTAEDVQLLAINTGSAPTRLNGVEIPSGRVGVIGGVERGYGGDGQPAPKALFDTRNNEHWFYGDLATTPDGTVYIADTVNNRIRRVDDGGVVTTVAGNGRTGPEQDDVPGSETSVWYPMGVDVDAHGDVVFSDWQNSLIRKLGRDGRVRTIAGNGSPAGCGEGVKAAGSTPTEGAGIGQAHDAVTDRKGNTYITDSALTVIRRVSPSGIIETVAGRPIDCRSTQPAVQGSPVCDSPADGAGDGGPIADAVLMAPVKMLLDGYDNLYVADGGRIRYLNFSRQDHVVHGVRVKAGTIETLARVEVGEIEQNGAQPAEMIGAAGLALDDTGTLYISSLATRQVLALNWCGDLVPIAGNGGIHAGTENSNGDGGTATGATIYPIGLAWDGPRGLLYIADMWESRVRVVNVTLEPKTLADGRPIQPQFIETLAGGGTCNGGETTRVQQRPWRMCIYGDGGPAFRAALRAPMDVAVDPGGRVFIADPWANLIRVVESDGRIGTLAGVTPDFFGSEPMGFNWIAGGFCGDGGSSTRACLGGVVGVDLSPDGDLLVAEQTNGRVRRIADATKARLRPIVYDPPVVGENWDFTSPVVLHDPQRYHGRDPHLVFDSKGRAYVIAPSYDNTGTPIACNLWRYDVNADGRGRDDSAYLGSPDVAVPLPVGAAPGVITGAACDAAIATPGSDIPVPPGAEDRLGVVSIGQMPWAQNARTGVSRDGGRTFLTSPHGVASSANVVRSPGITARGPDDFLMAYCCTSVRTPDQTGADALLLASSKGGVQYTHTGVIDTLSAAERLPLILAMMGKPIVVGSDIHVPYFLDVCRSENLSLCSTRFPSDTRLFVAKSTDGGLTWSRGPAVFSYKCTEDRYGFPVRGAWCGGYHGLPQVVADRAGNLYATWDDGNHVYLSTSRGNQQWTKPVRVDRGVTLATFPTITAGDDGRIAIAFLGSTSPAKNVGSKDAEYFVYLSHSANASLADPEFEQSVASPTRVHVGALCVQMRGGGCWGNGAGSQLLPATSAVGNFFRVVMHPEDGRVLISYTEDPGRGLEHARMQVIRQCGGPSLLKGGRPIPCLPGVVDGADVSRVETRCPPQAKDDRGEATYNALPHPQLDLVDFGVVRTPSGSGGMALSVRMTVDKFDLAPPFGATGATWTGFWRHGDNRFFAQASSPGAGGVMSEPGMAFTFGVVNAGGKLSKLADVTGRVDGNTIIVDVPLERLGSIPADGVLVDLHARTDAVVGATPETVMLPTARLDRVDGVSTTVGYKMSMVCEVEEAPQAQGGQAGAAKVVKPDAAASVPPLPDRETVGGSRMLPPPAGFTAPLASEAPFATGEPGTTVAEPATRDVKRISRPVPRVVREAVRGPALAAPGSRGGGLVAPARPKAKSRNTVPSLKLPAHSLPVICAERPPPPPPADPLPPRPAPEREPFHEPPVVPVPPPAIVVFPVAPPVTPVGPAPGPAPAQQPQPGQVQQAQPQSQPGSQNQVGQQMQPGQQVGMAGAIEAEEREARSFAASRRRTVPASAYAWAWTVVAILGVTATRRRRSAPAVAPVTSRRQPYR